MDWKLEVDVNGGCGSGWCFRHTSLKVVTLCMGKEIGYVVPELNILF
jgi:hypothetical protein